MVHWRYSFRGLPFLHPDLEEILMLWTIIVILLVLWLLGAFVRPVGGFVHLLLVIVLIIVVIQLLQ